MEKISERVGAERRKGDRNVTPIPTDATIKRIVVELNSLRPCMDLLQALKNPVRRGRRG
jgi:hypothetical protein